MLKCEKCGATVPNESKFCLNCGNRMDSSAPKHFSLDEIARQQQEQESGAFSITPEVPDDDPESYLPPIGAKEHSEIPKGEIDPEYFNHKPLPSIQAADPLELLDADTPELPPIGFSDQMQIEDFKMPEGIRHYHGSYAVPRNLQMQTAVPLSENGNTYDMLVQAQKKRQMTDQQAHGDKEHFSVIPEALQVRFRSDTDTTQKMCSFNDFFIDEYEPAKDIPPAKKPVEPKRPVKKLNVKPARKQIAVKQPAKKQEQPKISLDKTAAAAPSVTLEKTPPPPTVTLEKTAPPPPPAVTLEKTAPPPSPAVTLEKTAPPPPAVILEEKIPPKNDFNFQSPEPPKNDFNFQSPEPPKDTAQSLSTVPQNDFNNYMFSDPPSSFGNQSMNSYNSFNSFNNSPSMSYRSNGYANITSSYVPSTFDKVMIIAGLSLFVLRAVLIVAIVFCVISGLSDGVQTYANAFAEKYSPATAVSIDSFDRDCARMSNLNSGGLAAEDDDGTVYYTDGKGCLCRLSDSGSSKSIVYDGSRTNNYILYINCHDDRLYFLSSITGTKYSVCSVNKEGKDFKVYKVTDDPVCLIAHGNYLYYIASDSKKINRIDLKTEKTEKFYNASGPISNIFFSGNKMYVLVIDDKDYGGKVYTIETAAPSAVSSLKFTHSSTTLEPMNICLNGDRIIIADNSQYSPGVVYSAALDGSDVRKIGGSNILKVSGYGDLIYYSYINGNLKAAENAVANGNTSGIFNLGMMDPNGSSMHSVKNDVIYYSIAGNRIYYLGSDGGMFSMATNGTDAKNVP